MICIHTGCEVCILQVAAIYLEPGAVLSCPGAVEAWGPGVPPHPSQGAQGGFRDPGCRAITG